MIPSLSRLIQAVLLVSSMSAAFSQEPPSVEVKVHEWKQADGSIRYAYRVINHSSDRKTRKGKQIVSLIIGEDYYRDLFELLVSPIGWTFEKGLPKQSVSSPSGWYPTFVTQEESDLCELEWRINGGSDDLIGGRALRGFSVVTPKPDENYKTGHWTVIFSDSTIESSFLAEDDDPLPLHCLGAAERTPKHCQERQSLIDHPDPLQKHNQN